MVVVGHLGLGDHIVTASIVAQLSAIHNKIIIPCWLQNKESIESFYIDYPNVKTLVFNTEIELIFSFLGMNTKLMMGFYSHVKQKENEDFIEWFYRQAKLKELPFPFEQASKNVLQLNKVDIFIHDDKSRGFVIDKEGYRPERGGSILKHVNQLKNAKEIHCIDSSFIHLVERIETKGKLFYHKYARPNSVDLKLKKDWIVLNETRPRFTDNGLIQVPI